MKPPIVSKLNRPLTMNSEINDLGHQLIDMRHPQATTIDREKVSITTPECTIRIKAKSKVN
jgi:hypothetical protein